MAWQVSKNPRRPLLCVVSNRRLCKTPAAEALAAAVCGGADVIQLREKDLPGGALLALARETAAAIARAAGAVALQRTALIVNRRADIALAAEWHGVHLGGDAMALADARALLPAQMCIGVSTHAAAEVAAAVNAAAAADFQPPNYFQLAPIWAPLSKELPAGQKPLGAAALQKAVQQAGGTPVIAQGGITAQRARECMAAGAAGVAVTGAVLGAANPKAAAQNLRAALEQ